MHVSRVIIYMRIRITAPEYISGTIKLPASKSISNRALIINALAEDVDQHPTPRSARRDTCQSKNTQHPENLSVCDDTDVMVAAMDSVKKAKAEGMPCEINIKAAGTAMRFTTAFLSVTEGEYVITGTERMQHRPIEVLVNALRHLGADIEYVKEQGFPPLRIRGNKLKGGHLEIAGNVSSQYISALLMIGPVLEKGLTLHLTGNIISRPYIDLTISMMQEFGADAEWQSENSIEVKPKGYCKRPYFIENDWSGSSYWYELVALLGHKDFIENKQDGITARSTVSLPGLMDGSRQGDSAIKFMFSMLGVKTSFASREKHTPTTVTLKAHPCSLPRFDFDFISQPDLAQTLVVTTALMGIPFRFSGLQTLRIKETDRIAALTKEMKKLGYVLDDSVEGTLSWDGTRCEPDAEPAIDTYEDHRMAMAFAPAAIQFPGLIINNPEVVSKSYPQYWDDLKSVGFSITEEE